MQDHSVRHVKDQPDWILTPRAWSGDIAIGYELTGADLPNGDPETLQFVADDDTITLRWWEQALLYYRSIK